LLFSLSDLPSFLPCVIWIFILFALTHHKYFLPICHFSVHYAHFVLGKTEIFTFDWLQSNPSSSPFMICALHTLFKESFPPQCSKISPKFSINNFTVLFFKFKSLIILEFILYLAWDKYLI
jgi:hypothetical protein